MKSFYIASGLENANQVQELSHQLKANGWTHTYDWTVHGSVQDKGPEVISRVAFNELNGVVTAGTVIVLLPGGRGTHAELGAAIVAYAYTNKAVTQEIIIWAENEELFLQDSRICSFYWHPGVKRLVCPFDELADRLLTGCVDEIGGYQKWKSLKAAPSVNNQG
jgi:hypothetical protein